MASTPTITRPENTRRQWYASWVLLTPWQRHAVKAFCVFADVDVFDAVLY